MVKVKDHICTKCGVNIKLPDFDETKPISEYFRRWELTVLKHGWRHHHEDFPPQFKSFNKFMSWLLGTPEGKAWNRLQGKWRNKILNGLVTHYSNKEDEPATPEGIAENLD